MEQSQTYSQNPTKNKHISNVSDEFSLYDFSKRYHEINKKELRYIGIIVLNKFNIVKLTGILLFENRIKYNWNYIKAKTETPKQTNKISPFLDWTQNDVVVSIKRDFFPT